MLGRGRGDRGLGLRVGNDERNERRTGREEVGEQGKKSERKKGERERQRVFPFKGVGYTVRNSTLGVVTNMIALAFPT